MTRIAVTMQCRRVTASAEIRHVVTAYMPPLREVVALQVPARRGPPGRQGDPGEQGPPGTLQNSGTIIFNGGHF
ncbi:hypothetical protein DEM27_31870 [Metarhizobium album]|uniref:Uncharacterized protein n=1 Tax=Metarhizobium album TaxID=2182425 RepID=A0A2U2DFZ8_9HYPH|nr:hypothetical protein [Rhizobium album]PWE52247.1 hypothetical protein DEM27_31870 [Rhizobium album]